MKRTPFARVELDEDISEACRRGNGMASYRRYGVALDRPTVAAGEPETTPSMVAPETPN